MNRILYKISLLVLVLAFSACSKEFLEVEPTGSKLPSDKFLQTEDEVVTALIGVYDKIQFNYSHGGWASVYFMKNLPADDVLCAGGGSTDQSDYQNLDDFKISADNGKIETIWSNFYKTINACNTIINGVAAIEGATEGMKAAAGEAKALRAMTYFDLVVMFGDVPFFTENPVKTEDFHKPRTAKATIYAQIEQDLKDAINVLPLKSELSGANKFRFAKGAAQGLLGKVYLYEGKYSDAATVLGQVIASTQYDLEPNFANVWDANNEFGIESLFEVSYVSSEAYDWGNFPWGGGNESNIEAQLEGPRDVVFDLTNTSLNVRNGWGFNLPTAEIGDLFVAEGKGPRYAASLISAADLIATGGAIKPAPAGGHHDYEGYMRLKYVTKTTETNTTGAPELNYTVNWRLLRYGDVLLLAAEAYHKSGQDPKAVIELNKVRGRAGLPLVANGTSGTTLFNAIKKERQMELAFEGSRYWDLIRWGDASAQMSNIGFVAGKHELFPIPLNEIIANNLIEQTDQNPGY